MKIKLTSKKIAFSILLVLLFSFHSITQFSIEYMVKASIIEKIVRFTDWGPNLKGDYFVIDVLGESPFNGELEKMASKTRIKNKPVKINYIDNYLDIKNPQVVFICSSEKNKLPKIIKHIEGKNILTISDTPGFGEKGVLTNLYLDKSETIKFEINLASLNKANLTFDMHLLTLGKVIK